MSSIQEQYAAGQARGVEAVAADLGRYGDALIPGAARMLAERNANLGQLSPDKRAEKIAELIESPGWARFLNPEHAPARLENGQPLSPLRAALSRHAPDLKPGSVDALTGRWAAELAHLKPGPLAAEVVRRLASRGARDYLVNPAPLPAYEDRVSGMAQHHFRDLMSPAAADRLAAERAHEWRHLSERELVATVAGILRSPEVAARYGAKPLPGDDARLKPDLGLSSDRPRPGPAPAATPTPARDASGKFSEVPEKRRPTTGF